MEDVEVLSVICTKSKGGTDLTVFWDSGWMTD
jgi:hypothetical protein